LDHKRIWTHLTHFEGKTIKDVILIICFCILLLLLLLYFWIY